MAHFRAQLQAVLDELDEAVPRLLSEHPDPGDFWTAFAAIADGVADNAGADDCSWVDDQLDAILERHHLVPPADQI